MASSVPISVEVPNENQIQEIGYDGTETYQSPLTLSENLSRCAAKIDFSKDKTATELQKIKTEEGIKKEEDSKETQQQPALWPWDSVRNKLKDAFTEVCVLSDVLSIAKEKRYMVLDPVPQETPEVKPIVLVYARKQALIKAGKILSDGAERLRSSQKEQSPKTDFHIDLLRLRQNWRLKKVSNGIIGDLSYRTAGSKFMHSNGMFEVIKADDEDEEGNTSGTPGSSSGLRVNVPSQLQGVAYIKVVTQKDQEDLCTASVNLHGYGANISQQTGVWQKTLEFAQNVLFCKELFNQLAREAVQLQAPIPHVVVGNQIRATLLPGIQLIISLCHSTDPKDPKETAPINDHDHVLEHSLHQLLREVHHKNMHHPFPHPASGPIGPSKKRSLAGPMAFDRYELLEMTKSQTLLEQIIGQAQHIFMRKRTQYVLDTLARDVKDPQITSHWNSMNFPTLSCVKINITSYGFDASRSNLLIHVKERSLKAICKDGRVMNMSYEPQELRDLILCQISHHQIAGLQILAKCMAWQILSNSSNLGIGSVEPLGNASSCLLCSPNGDKMIAVQVRCDPQIDVKVYIAQCPNKDFTPGPILTEEHWAYINVEFQEVQFDKMEGRNFLNKMEYLMAALIAPP
ncbi:mediator of RNA polymerase II transcription subunit 17 [Culicoides brevitarsis]|uniref:mediator of RNA polymerase II transcription subunit 17 n=1 Tax=Culicoides brevitarsis TaxID=469753 RepID=UPI00307BF2E5